MVVHPGQRQGYAGGRRRQAGNSCVSASGHPFALDLGMLSWPCPSAASVDEKAKLLSRPELERGGRGCRWAQQAATRPRGGQVEVASYKIDQFTRNSGPESACVVRLIARVSNELGTMASLVSVLENKFSFRHGACSENRSRLQRSGALFLLLTDLFWLTRSW